MKKILSAALVITVMFWACSKSGGSPGTGGAGAVTIGQLDATYPGQFTLNDTTYMGQCWTFSDTIYGYSIFEVGIENVEGNDTLHNTFGFTNMPSATSGNFPISSFYNPLFQTTDSAGAEALLHHPLGQSGTVYIAQSGTLTKTGATSFTFTCTVSNPNTPSTTYKVTGKGTY